MPDQTFDSEYDAAPGDPLDRRHHLRRRADKELLWAAICNHWGKLVTIVSVMALFVSTIANAIGLSVAGPPQGIAVITRRIDTLGVRVVRLEELSVVRGQRLDKLESVMRFQSYLLCVQLRRTDPSALPPDCTPIIESRGVP